MYAHDFVLPISYFPLLTWLSYLIWKPTSYSSNGPQLLQYLYIRRAFSRQMGPLSVYPLVSYDDRVWEIEMTRSGRRSGVQFDVTSVALGEGGREPQLHSVAMPPFAIPPSIPLQRRGNPTMLCVSMAHRMENGQLQQFIISKRLVRIDLDGICADTKYLEP